MNSPTAKLLKRFALWTGKSEHELKEGWNSMDHRERYYARQRMRHLCSPDSSLSRALKEKFETVKKFGRK